MNNLNGLESQLRGQAQAYIAARHQADKYTKEVRRNEKQAKTLELRNEIESWLKANPSASEAQLQAKFRGLLPKSKLLSVKKDRLAAGINAYASTFAEDYVIVKERQLANAIKSALTALNSVRNKYVAYFIKVGYSHEVYYRLLTWTGSVEITSNKEAARYSIGSDAVISVDLRKSYYQSASEGEHSYGQAAYTEMVTPHTTISWTKPPAWPTQIDVTDIDTILSAYSQIKTNPPDLLSEAEFAEAQARALIVAQAKAQANAEAKAQANAAAKAAANAEKEKQAAQRKAYNYNAPLPPYNGGRPTRRRKNNGKRKTRARR
jgi:hypothetical protein